MGMHARLAHVPADKLEAIRKSPTRFYQKNFGVPEGADPAGAATVDLLHKDHPYQKIQAKIKAAMSAIPEFQEIENLRKRGKPVPTELLQRAQVANQKLMKDLQALPEVTQFADEMKTAGIKEPAPNQQVARRRPKGAGLDKSWHCLHFVLAGHPTESGDSAAGMSILGGTEIPDRAQGMGYGPARYLTAEQVKAASEALQQFPIEERSREFNQNQAEAAQIYCPNFTPEELQHYFQVLQSYYQEAAAKGHAMLLWIE